jgi:hypothetical protein
MTEPIAVEIETAPDWNIVLVGGNEDVQAQMRRKLSSVNISIGAIWTDPRHIQTTFPARCNGLLILKDFTSHNLAERSRDAAVKAGVRWAYIQRKWASTLNALSVTGFIPPTAGSVGHRGGRISKVENKLIRTFVAHATGKRVTVEASARVQAAIKMMDNPRLRSLHQAIGSIPLAALLEAPPRETDSDEPIDVTPQSTPQDPEPEDMSKPTLAVNVQTVPQTPSKPTREELIELLKMTALELMSDHHVFEIHISEKTGINLKVMEHLTVKL